MKALVVEIVRYVDEHQPGFVECRFTDANGYEHSIIEKVPVVSDEILDSTSKLPKQGVAACSIIANKSDRNGLEVLSVDIGTIWSMETVEGKTLFDVYPEQLKEI